MTDSEPLTPERMLTLMEQHGRYEYASDIEGTMATVGDDPVWEFHPLGLRAAGRDAVRAVYELEFEYIFPRTVKSSLRLGCFTERGLLRELNLRLRAPDGSEVPGLVIIAMEFQPDGRISSERAYASGAEVDLIASCFPESIWSMPGISRFAG
jgi:hypothetical protein